MSVLGWVAVFVAIALGGAAVLAWLVLGLWRRSGALLGELDVLADRVGDLAGLLAQVEVPSATTSGPTRTVVGSEPGWDSDDAWPGTVETYDDRGADAPGKRER